MATSTNLLLTLWSNLTDRFNHIELKDNWEAIDAHDHTGSGKGLLIPAGGLEPNAVLNTNLAPNSVNSNSLANGAVIESKLADVAVTTRKLGDSAVTSPKIQPGSVELSHLAAAVLDALDPTTIMPTGAIMAFGGATAPVGWFLCQGSSQSRTNPTFTDLFAVIGTTYGAVDSTHFTLPDLRGRAPIGSGTATGAVGATAHARGSRSGEEKHTLLGTESGIAKHHHTAPKVLNGIGSGAVLMDSRGITHWYLPGGDGGRQIGQYSADTADIASTSASLGHNNMQPYQTLDFIIRL